MKYILVPALILFFGVSYAFALATPTEDLMKIGAGARPMGMGKAFTAVADDGNSVFFNPAGLAQLKSWQFTSMYVNMMEGDLPYTLVSASVPFRAVNFGLGAIATGVSNIPSPGSGSLTYFDYYDRLIFLSCATTNKYGNLSVGANLKYFQKGFSSSVGNTGSGVNLDLGIKLQPEEDLMLGANIQNVLPTDVVWTSGAQDEIPPLLKLGWGAWVLGKKAMLAADVEKALTRSQPALFHFGGEWPVNNFLCLRGGVDQIASAASIVTSNPTAGISLTLGGARFDYAYHPYQDLTNYASHFISFSFAPGKKPASSEP